MDVAATDKDETQKVFDIAPPPTAKPTATVQSRQMASDPAKREDAGEHQKQAEDISLAGDGVTKAGVDTEEESLKSSEPIASVSRPAFTITDSTIKKDDSKPPVGSNSIQEPQMKTDSPSVDPLPESQPEIAPTIEPTDAKSSEPDNSHAEAPTHEPDDTEGDKLVSEQYGVVDALPDPMQKTSEEALGNMQDPKIFDTKEFIVPIGNTHHTHGSLKASLVFGFILAAAVLGGGYLYMTMFVK